MLSMLHLRPCDLKPPPVSDMHNNLWLGFWGEISLFSLYHTCGACMERQKQAWTSTETNTEQRKTTCRTASDTVWAQRGKLEEVTERNKVMTASICWGADGPPWHRRATWTRMYVYRLMRKWGCLTEVCFSEGTLPHHVWSSEITQSAAIHRRGEAVFITSV